MGRLILSKSTKVSDEQYLRINRNAGKINSRFVIIKYRDKDTRQIVVYAPSLEITGYGSDDKKAMQMATFSIKEYFKSLIGLSQKALEVELSRLGWKHNRIKKKEYSKVYVDATGELNNFNAVADKIEKVIVTL